MRVFALAMLCMVPVVLFSQGPVVTKATIGSTDYLWQVTDSSGKTSVPSKIFNRTFTSLSIDTAQGIPTYDTGALWLIVTSKDSASILISYQLSNDGLVWTAPRLVDSLKMTNQTQPVVKSLNLSAPADSAAFIRPILEFSAKAFAKGTTTPTYSARYAIKRD